ncbi:hypothetical protein Pelo_13788 [Pelomyxa schiedti]|nr:hypothetical protein Pelo_13788 [Pelomyxa schiedti]
MSYVRGSVAEDNTENQQQDDAGADEDEDTDVEFLTQPDSSSSTPPSTPASKCAAAAHAPTPPSFRKREYIDLSISPAKPRRKSTLVTATTTTTTSSNSNSGHCTPRHPLQQQQQQQNSTSSGVSRLLHRHDQRKKLEQERQQQKPKRGDVAAAKNAAGGTIVGRGKEKGHTAQSQPSPRQEKHVKRLARATKLDPGETCTDGPNVATGHTPKVTHSAHEKGISVSDTKTVISSDVDLSWLEAAQLASPHNRHSPTREQNAGDQDFHIQKQDDLVKTHSVDVISQHVADSNRCIPECSTLDADTTLVDAPPAGVTLSSPKISQTDLGKSQSFDCSSQLSQKDTQLDGSECSVQAIDRVTHEHKSAPMDPPVTDLNLVSSCQKDAQLEHSCSQNHEHSTHASQTPPDSKPTSETAHTSNFPDAMPGTKVTASEESTTNTNDGNANIESVKTLTDCDTGGTYINSALCPVCQINLSVFDEAARDHHVNACLDGKPASQKNMTAPESTTSEDDVFDKPSLTALGPKSNVSDISAPVEQPSDILHGVYTCPWCGKDLATKDFKSRFQHTKACAKKFKITTHDTRSHSTTSTNATAVPVSKAKPKTTKPRAPSYKKRRKGGIDYSLLQPNSTEQERLMLAVAISESESRQQNQLLSNPNNKVSSGCETSPTSAMAKIVIGPAKVMTDAPNSENQGSDEEDPPPTPKLPESILAKSMAPQTGLSMWALSAGDSSILDKVNLDVLPPDSQPKRPTVHKKVKVASPVKTPKNPSVNACCTPADEKTATKKDKTSHLSGPSASDSEPEEDINAHAPLPSDVGASKTAPLLIHPSDAVCLPPEVTSKEDTHTKQPSTPEELHNSVSSPLSVQDSKEVPKEDVRKQPEHMQAPCPEPQQGPQQKLLPQLQVQPQQQEQPQPQLPPPQNQQQLQPEMQLKLQLQQPQQPGSRPQTKEPALEDSDISEQIQKIKEDYFKACAEKAIELESCISHLRYAFNQQIQQLTVEKDTKIKLLQKKL